ncbi:Aste57867_19173 [Aphanomyces stellatus]|uniref:Histone-lysine N-methyltransferase, H3 lysine-79 specific n=1 Tax=Aphanomyces stellatus TaxID=120398 RepID=A0A485LCK5_9STRA|nr:hypothetical protein As57867_019109 [Aphanomyces stellatus]VFT95895.1 Aste57867_19173 [Aphanomyces stellatus]
MLDRMSTRAFDTKKRKHQSTMNMDRGGGAVSSEDDDDLVYQSPEPTTSIEGVDSLSPQSKKLHPARRLVSAASSPLQQSRWSPDVIDLTGDDDEDDKPPPPTSRRITPRVHHAIITGPIFDLTDESSTPTLGRTEALDFLRRAFAEVEKDDRPIYKLSEDVVRNEMATCDLSELVQHADPNDLFKMTTYGEIEMEAFSRQIIPLLQLTESDVFYDLGCGTGKPVLQVALETTCRVAKGMELFLNRVETGQRALGRLHDICPSVVEGKEVRIVQGDLVKPPPEANLLDATVVFINNVVFTDDLMLAVMGQLRRMKKLKRVIVSKKLCERHAHKICARGHSACVLFQHPPREEMVDVTWTSTATVYVYQRMHFV